MLVVLDEFLVEAVLHVLGDEVADLGQGTSVY